jgi:hypothetical protein
MVRPGGLLLTGLVGVGVGLALMTLYAVWVADQEPYDVAAVCGSALGDSPDDPAFRRTLDLDSSFFPPSVSCVSGSHRAELIDERARTSWIAVELLGFTLTSTGMILVIVGVWREWRTAKPVGV